MEDLPELDFRIKMSSSPDFLDLERTLCQDDVDSYSRNMDRLFADDEIKNAPQTSTSSPPSVQLEAKSCTYFSSAAFWRRETESVKVGVILSRLEDKFYFLMCDASKKVLEKLVVDDLEIQFFKKELGVRIELKPDSVENTQSEAAIEVKFVDLLTLLRFAVTALIRSTHHQCFKLSDGSGDFNINSSCDIRYNITDHSLDEEGALKLPDERKGVKTRLSRDKLNDHVIYKWIGGLQKGCHLLVKASESSVYEIYVDKVRKPLDTASIAPSEVSEPIDSSSDYSNVITELKEKVPNPNSSSSDPVSVSEDLVPEASSDPDIASAPTAELPESTPEAIVEVKSVPEPPTTSSTVPEDLRDVLHRIVGIEMDRIEMRLNAKLDTFQVEMRTRLDQQTAMLQQILDRSSIN